MPSQQIDPSDFERCLQIGRPPTVTSLFPNSKALLVSGKYIDRSMLRKGQAICLAANARNSFVLKGALLGAQRANACLIIEIAKSEGGGNAYCPVSLWNIARQVDAACNELGITIPVAVHADHYGIKKEADIADAKVEIPTLFDAGITSIAIDASHLPDEQNLLTSIELNPLVPDWAGLETEVGEIKGKAGLSTPDEALFLIRGLNAHDIFPDWIALNNGSTHGLEATGDDIDVGLTQRIHEVLAPYNVSGAQHGTSGNSSAHLREIAQKTKTTKANVATALQMIAWGVKVNDYGNAMQDEQGHFIKVPGQGMNDELWKEMTAYAADKGLKGGDFKKLNLPFENKLLGQPREIKDRMVERVAQFVTWLVQDVFNAQDTAPMIVEDILKSNTYHPGPKAERIEDPAEWTKDKIMAKAASLGGDKGPAGDFDD